MADRHRGYIRIIQFAAAMAIVLSTAVGWAQSEGPATFTPTIQQKFAARSAPAKVTSEAESALTSKGYVQIGTISASQPGSEPNAGATKQLESAILQKAAEAGGDVVRLSKDGLLEKTYVPTGKYEPGGCLQEHDFFTGNGQQSIKICDKWERGKEKTRTVKALVSEGDVWRYYPKLAADIASAAAAAREATQKAAEAAREEAQKREAAKTDYERLQERLHASLADRNSAEAKLLLAQGANINERDKYGDTLLKDAASRDDSRDVEFLLALGADVNSPNVIGDSPLHSAAENARKQAAQLLLAHGANVNAKDKQGDTPLHFSANHSDVFEYEHISVAKLLLANGADVNAKDNMGDTPLRKAFEFKKMADLLRKHGGDK